MLQELMPYIGFALQWARARGKFADIYYAAIVAAVSVAAYAFATNGQVLAAGWVPFLQGWWGQAKEVLALTQITSTAANVISDARGSGAPVPLILPVTDSK